MKLLGYPFLKALQKREIKKTYYILVGEEELMMESTLRLLNTQLAPCDIKTYYADETSPSEILQSASSPGLFSQGRQVTVIKGIERMRRRTKKALADFFSAVGSPQWNPENPVVFYICLLGLDDRKKRDLLRTFREFESENELDVFQRGILVEFPLLSEGTEEDQKLLEKWIKNWFARKGISIDRALVSSLKTVLPSRLKEADAELRKLLLYTDGKSPTKDDAETVVSKSDEVLMKDLSKVIQQGNQATSALVLKKLLEKGVKPNHILAYLLIVLGKHIKNAKSKDELINLLQKAEKAVELEGKFKSQRVSESLLLLTLSLELSK